MLSVQTTQNLSLSKKQSLAWKYLTDSTTTEILYGGGAGGGKSFLGCVWHIFRRTTYPETRGLIGRAKLSALEQSTLITLLKVAHDMGYINGVDYRYNSQKNIINWLNGSVTILKDLFLYPADPDFISLGSTEYTDAFIDEGTEITTKAFEILNSRIRWKLNEYGLIPKILVTCNPGLGWVKERYIVHDNKLVKLKDYQKFVQALVTDNPDKEFVKLYELQLNRLTNDYDKQRLLYGDWEAEREVESPFCNHYNPFKHESTLAVFQPSKQLVISVDFNLNPFAVTFHHAWQDSTGFHHHQFDEGEIAHGSIPAMVEFIRTKYHRYLYAAILTGDAMGNRGDISQRDNATLYQQLLLGLGMTVQQLRVHGNPTHENSRADVNYFMVHFPDYKINPTLCPNTCRDARVVQVDIYGQILKRNRNDLNQRADFLDAGIRYPIHNLHRQWIVNHQRMNYMKPNGVQKTNGVLTH